MIEDIRQILLRRPRGVMMPLMRVGLNELRHVRDSRDYFEAPGMVYAFDPCTGRLEFYPPPDKSFYIDIHANQRVQL